MVLYKTKTDHLDKVSNSAKNKKSEAESMTDYVKNGKKCLKLTMLDLQNRLETLEILSEMPDAVKMEFLFTNLDKDHNNRISVSELSDGLRKVNAGVSFQEGIQQAIREVAMNDTDGDASLDREEFKEYMEKLTERADVTFKALAEFTLMQVIFSESGNTSTEKEALEIRGEEIDKAVKALEIYQGIYKDVRLVELYELFDVDGDGTIEFKEVALGMYKITGDMAIASKSALHLVLMTDQNGNRRIDYPEFVRLILQVCTVAGEKFEDIISEFVTMMYFAEKIGIKDAARLMIAEEDYNAYQDMIESADEAAAILDILQYTKILKLFDLWDINNDKSISLEELTLGCRKFQRSIMDIRHTVTLSHLMMHEFDKDGNKSLNEEEFARFLLKFAEETKSDIHGMIDTLAVITVLENNSEEEESYIKIMASNLEEGHKNDEKSYTISFKQFGNENDEELWA